MGRSVVFWNFLRAYFECLAILVRQVFSCPHPVHTFRLRFLFCKLSYKDIFEDAENGIDIVSTSAEVKRQIVLDSGFLQLFHLSSV